MRLSFDELLDIAPASFRGFLWGAGVVFLGGFFFLLGFSGFWAVFMNTHTLKSRLSAASLPSLLRAMTGLSVSKQMQEECKPGRQMAIWILMFFSIDTRPSVRRRFAQRLASIILVRK